MTQVVQAPQFTRLRRPIVFVSAVISLGVAVVVQPVLEPSPLALVVTIGAILVLLVRLRYLRRRWVHATSVLVGAGVAALVYVELWLMAAATGFPSHTFGSPDAPITEVYVDVDDLNSNQLHVVVATCSQNPQVTARETAGEVWLSSNERVHRGGSTLDCADGASVVLKEPVGDRRVIDEATGKALEVTVVR